MNYKQSKNARLLVLEKALKDLMIRVGILESINEQQAKEDY